MLVRQGISIVSSQSFALPNPDNTEPREVAELGLSIDSNPATAEFNFFATHLAHDSTAGRQQSATYINNLVASSTVPSILAGDMNFNPGSTAYNIMDNQWIDASSPTLSDNQIDYVWYRSSSQWDVTTPGAFIRNATTDVASDHHPLLAVLNLKTVWPGSALIWNINTGVATPVTDGFATGNGSGAVGRFPRQPVEHRLRHRNSKPTHRIQRQRHTQRQRNPHDRLPANRHESGEHVHRRSQRERNAYCQRWTRRRGREHQRKHRRLDRRRRRTDRHAELEQHEHARSPRPPPNWPGRQSAPSIKPRAQ